MDGIDRAILRQLQADGRLTNVELAERVRLSPSPCLRRVRALERAGAIRGYHADIDPAAVDRGFEVTVHVELTLKDRATVEAFEAGDRRARRGGRVPPHVRPARLRRSASRCADQAAYETFYMNKLAELPGPRARELAVHDEDGQGGRRATDRMRASAVWTSASISR